MEVVQQGGAEDNDDGAAAQVGADDGCVVTDLIQDGAEDDHKGKAAGHAGGQNAQISSCQNHYREDGEVVPGQIEQLVRLLFQGLCVFSHDKISFSCVRG